MTAGNGGGCSFKLKAKEKVLVQLYLHMCGPDDGVFPFEVTQKGLSDHLGLRRSHVAVALQELAKDGMVEVAKGHIEEAQRRQNAYCITAGGLDAAKALCERLFEVEVSFESAEGTSTVKVSELVNSRRANLTSVIVQLERGSLVRDEITIVTRPERKLISVFCPTCKKQIEVDNVFFEEEVGFDCPGCGRPYRIVPALKAEKVTVRRARFTSNAAVAVAVALAAVVVLALALDSVCLSTIIIIGAAGGIFVWLLVRERRIAKPKPRTRTSAVLGTVIISPLLLILWHMTIATVDPYETIAVLLPMLAAAAAGYLCVVFLLPDFRGDYLLSAGLVIIMVAAATMFVVEFGWIDVGMALAVGISGAVIVVLSTFHPIDRDAKLLDGAASTGSFLLLLAGVVLVPGSEEMTDLLASGAVAVLGVVLVGTRAARELTGAKDISSHLLASVPLTVAVSLLGIGVLLIEGGAVLAGAVELAAAAPFGYFGLKQVLNKDWPYRVPLVTAFLAVIALALIAGLLT